jgi:hypothetical protein
VVGWTYYEQLSNKDQMSVELYSHKEVFVFELLCRPITDRGRLQQYPLAVAIVATGPPDMEDRQEMW